MRVSSAARLDSEAPSWCADAELAADIRPAESVATGRDVVLSGATGFLGRHIARQLLEREDGDVYCLARSGQGGSARERVESEVLAAGADPERVNARLHVLEADLTRPHLGIAAHQYESLAHKASAIVHCAADVSWVKSYPRLRASNVLSVTPLLRLACHGKSKHFALISSIGVCYSTNPHLRVMEETDPFTYMSTIPLGYAQSKAVAERLVRRAVQRGLNASIFRPSLITGDSDGKYANAEDFVSLLLQGCIRMGHAPDSDWQVDVVPVDFVSRAVVANLGQYRGLRTLHLSHPEPRSWRELILFLNLYGYTIRLEPLPNWFRRLERFPDVNLPLKRLQGFFASTAPGSAGRSVSQFYEASAHARINSGLSGAYLATQRLRYPKLNSDYFSAYLMALRQAGVIDRPQRERAARDSQNVLGIKVLRALHPYDPNWRPATFESRCSIVTEIASWRCGGPLGLYGVSTAESASDHANFVLKIKARDCEATSTAVEVLSVAHPHLVNVLERYSNQLQLQGAEARETSFYSAVPELLEFAPRCHAQGRHPETNRAMLLLERLDNVELLNSVDQPHLWTDAHLTCAVRDLATIHAAQYEVATPLRAMIRDAERVDADSTLQALPFHQAVAQTIEPYLQTWGGTELVAHVRNLIAGMAAWMPRYARLPTALIHNDCNPRNMAFRREGGNLRTCWYDWELCAWAPPQRDLAELLCFTLSAEDARDQSVRYVELHRQQLSAILGREVDSHSWAEGFQLALAELMVRRLALYTLLHHSVRQSFLPRVVQTWKALSLATSC